MSLRDRIRPLGTSSVLNLPGIRWLRSLLNKEELWAIKRIPIARGLAIGMFSSMLPIPFQMILAALCSIALRANAPVAIAAVWISNPLTWVPVYTGNYLLGCWLLGYEPLLPEFDRSVAIALISLGNHLWVLWVGCIAAGLVLAALGAALILYVPQIMHMLEDYMLEPRDSKRLPHGEQWQVENDQQSPGQRPE